MPELVPGTKSVLASFRALANVPEPELATLLALFRPTTLCRGERLLRAGDTARSLAFVESGLLRLYDLDAEGREFTKSFCAEGEVVAAYSALLLDQPSRLFIEALEDSRLLVADYRAYQELAARALRRAVFLRRGRLAERKRLVKNLLWVWATIRGAYPQRPLGCVRLWTVA